MRSLRWWSLLLVPGGFVAGHELGYAAASLVGAPPVPGGGHTYLTVVVLAGAPFAFAAMIRGFLAGMREQLPPVGWRTLALAQVSLFTAVELTEHRAAGLGPVETLAQPAVMLGLAAQVAVAALLHLMVRTSHKAGAAVASARQRRAVLVIRPSWRPAGTGSAAVIVPVCSMSRRGPPGAVLVSST
ncbi:MAG TPA: hypothetical protein VFG94_07410 [Acidimicrobiales bacterium]|nr:hypothetical protein [Acidimicrobiales bacterium]